LTKIPLLHRQGCWIEYFIELEGFLNSMPLVKNSDDLRESYFIFRWSVGICFRIRNL